MAKRPFFSTRIDEIEALVQSPDTSTRILGQIQEELHHRSTFRAQRLRKELKRKIGIASTSPRKSRSRTVSAGSMPEIEPTHLSARLMMMGLSSRAKSFFRSRGLTYVGELCQLSEQEVWKSSNVGRTTLDEMKKVLEKLGLHFGQDVANWTPGDADRISRVASLPAALRLPEPPTLTEAFRLRLERVAASERNVRWTLEHMGWSGAPPQTLEAIGGRDGVTRERVRQVNSKCCAAILEQFGPPRTLLRAIELLRRNAPISSSSLNALLVANGLTSNSFDIGGIKSAAALYGLPFRFVVQVSSSDPLILPTRMRLLAQRVLIGAKNEISARGCISEDQLAELTILLTGKPLEMATIRNLLTHEGSFSSLANAPEWWWRPASASRKRNRLVNTIRKVLAVSPEILLTELRDAVRRPVRARGYAPPGRVLKALCNELPFATIDGEWLVRAERDDWPDVLNGSERALVEIFQGNGPVLDNATLFAAASAAGIGQDNLNMTKAYSPLLWRPAPGQLALVGAEIPVGLVEEIGRSRAAPSSSLVASGWTSTSQVYLCYRITDGLRRSGTPSVPAAFRTIVRGSYNLSAPDEKLAFEIAVNDGAITSVRKLLGLSMVDAGDSLLIVFDNDKRSCETWVGGGELARSVLQNDPDRALADLRQRGTHANVEHREAELEFS